MPDLELRGIPDRLYRKLTAAAMRNNRSLNDEIVARLSEPDHREPVDPAGILDRIRARRGTIGKLDLSEENLRQMRNAGRP